MLVVSTTPLALVVSSFPRFHKFPIRSSPFPRNPISVPLLFSSPSPLRAMSWLGKLGLGFGGRTSATAAADPAGAAVTQGPDDDVPAAGQQFAQFGAGCFWGVELVFQRVAGVTKTEVGYTQGLVHNPSYEDVCSGSTGHSEVVRVQYDPAACRYEDLLDAFWARHDPTTVNRQCVQVSSRIELPRLLQFPVSSFATSVRREEIRVLFS